MTKINDGGPAFPPSGTPHPTDPSKVATGLSLRDWFAGQALAGALARDGAMNSSVSTLHREHFAARIYEIADAMLAAREVAK